MCQLLKPEKWQPADEITLEDAALRVVTSTDNRSVIAGPGSGKTELLAQRALYLLQTGQCKPPQRILAICFKRDAAKNLKDRVARRCSTEHARRLDSYTFDAFAKSLVDRFLALAPSWCRPPHDYRMQFPTRDDWNLFTAGLTPPNELGGMAAARALRLDSVERWGPLPVEPREPADMAAWMAIEWWRQSLSSSQPGISFPMIGRLAEAILAYNPEVLTALRLTYSHVFLDEFQDTTGAQYALTKLMFEGSAAVLTAVGDTKQRIMTWAGAEAEVFSQFERSFKAKREMLQINHRSNQRIVQIINDLVTEIEPNAVETLCARPTQNVPENAAAFWVFDTDDDEAEWLANFIAADIANSAGDRGPDNFALLTRVRANQVEAQLRDAFAAQGLQLRNEARLVNGIAIQELMVDELASSLLGLLRLAVGARARDVYSSVQETLGSALGVDYGNPADLRRLDDALRRVIAICKSFTMNPPAEAEMAGLISDLVSEVGEARLRRTFRQYDDETYFRNVQSALAVLMAEHAIQVNDWKELIDRVEGVGQVRLMTVHKSKGHEYDTVIFVGLHQNAFFGYKANRTEETCIFFVGLSRARERVFFTRSKESGPADQIEGLVDLLAKADVPTVRIEG